MRMEQLSCGLEEPYKPLYNSYPGMLKVISCVCRYIDGLHEMIRLKLVIRGGKSTCVLLYRGLYGRLLDTVFRSQVQTYVSKIIV